MGAITDKVAMDMCLSVSFNFYFFFLMWQLRNVKCAHVAFLLDGAHLDSLLSLLLSWLRPIVFNSTNWCPGPGAEPEPGAVATEVEGLGRGGP